MSYLKKHIHPAWIMLFLCVLMTVTSAIGHAAVATNLTVIRQNGGYTATQTSLYNTIRNIASLITLAVYNKLYTRFGLKKLMSVGMMISVSAYLIIAFFGNSLIAIYIAGAIIGFVCPFIWLMSSTYLLNNWFVRCIGLALSLASSGSGLSNFIFAPLISGWYASFGFKTTFLIEAAITLVVAILLALFLVDDPSKMGLEAYGNSSGTVKVQTDNISGNNSHKLSNHLGLLVGAAFLIGFGSGSSSSHLSLTYTYMGIDPVKVSSAISLYGIVLVLSKLVCGTTIDKSGTRTMTRMYGVLQVVGMICPFLSLFIPYVGFMYLSVVLYGIGAPIQTLGYPKWAAEFTSKDNYVKLFKDIQLGTSFGELAGSLAIGLISDAFGYYNYAYLLFTITMIIAISTVLLMYRHIKE